ncbi:MAG: hypothetical protein KGJ13_05655 [Patescibacteria group bacterium]|nr:hypothetical protein [Patescibacteria group bacterium]
MLQIRAIREFLHLTNEAIDEAQKRGLVSLDAQHVILSEINPVKFGYDIHYSSAVQYNLASQEVPYNVALAVLRVQTYLVDVDNTTTDYQFYRVQPKGLAWWETANSVGGTALQQWTNPNAPAFLATDCDELLLFPPGLFANLYLTPAAAAPAAGTWQIQTVVYGFMVPARVYDLFSTPQSWINVQQ